METKDKQRNFFKSITHIAKKTKVLAGYKDSSGSLYKEIKLMLPLKTLDEIEKWSKER